METKNVVKLTYDHRVEVSEDGKVLRAWDLKGREVKPTVKMNKKSSRWMSGVGVNYRTFVSKLRVGTAKYYPMNED